MEQKKKNKQQPKNIKENNLFFSDILFNSGLFILLFIVINVLLTSTMFIFHVSISSWYLWTSLFLTTIILIYFLHKKDNLNFKYIVGSFILPLIIIFSSIFVSSKFIDFTWDGNSYHKSTIGFLIDGWNPLYETMKELDYSFKDILKDEGFWEINEMFSKESNVKDYYLFAELYRKIRNLINCFCLKLKME